MRHALLSEQWFPNIGGSIQLFDAIYGRSMPPGDFVHVIAGDSRGASAHDATYPRPVTRFDATRHEWLHPESTLAYARMLGAALRVCARERIEILHCARVIPEGLVGMAVHRALGVPFTVWAHGEEVSMYMRYAVKRRLMPRVFGAARAVLVNSHFTRGKALIAGAPEATLRVVHPTVDAEVFEGPFDTSDLAARFETAGHRILLTVGRLTQRKGHDVMLRALARLRDQGALGPTRWLVLSEGEREGELKALTRALHLDDVVRWVGPVSRQELPRYYALADLFVMPNRTLGDADVEGFGIVFLEASAAGVPVIGGRSGGVPDAVDDGVTGLLVDGASEQEVADAIHALLSDDARRAAMGQAGRTWAKRFSREEAALRVREASLGQ
jgi:phosphatidylinositol alpha-1,6-mannosyltransferase